jgi:hypothetical protein
MQAYMLISMPTGNSTILGAFLNMFKTPRDFVAKCSWTPVVSR